MKKTATTILLMILFSINTTSQNNFDTFWTRVEKLEVDNLPKTALEIVDKIYTEAEKENNAPQIIKSLFYKSKFSLILEENAQLKVIQQFKNQISKSKFPTKNVLENILANLYWQYYTQNRYKFYRRTKTELKADRKSSSENLVQDFRTWDLNTLFEEIHYYYKASLKEEKKLQNIAIGNFEDILNLQKNNKTYSPTLYDFLANNALEFYKTSETSITRPSYKFVLDNAAFLSVAEKFTSLNITSKDSISLQLNALKIYQKLIHFHLKENNQNALTNIDIERLQFVEKKGIFKNKEDVLFKTLENAKEKNKNHESSGLYAFEIARILKNKGNFNTIKSSETKHNFNGNLQALKVCNEVIENFPKSLGASKCAILKEQIVQKTLSITAEEFVPINTNSRFLISYKNIDKLFFTAYQVSEQEQLNFNKIYKNKEKITFLRSLKVVKNWNSTLRNENDYLNHTTEIIVPKFKNGLYLIVASEKKEISEKNIFGTTTFQVTNLALVTSTFNNKNNYQIVDRNTGKPIKKAEIHLKNKRRDRGNYINKKLKTDKNGFANYSSNKYYNNVTIKVISKNDVAIFGNYYLYKQQSNSNKIEDDEITIKPFIFTDRSIYRPGQTVYFKAIVLKKQGNKIDVFKNEYVEVTLNDVNNQEVKKLHLKLNEFGSVAGEFVIPNNGLTGEFEIEIDESYDFDSKFYDEADFDFMIETTNISIEEYKRPKFKPEFKSITKSYKINDSITINGFAKAFSGANITDAKVVYRVFRKVQYPSWYYWRNPNANSSSQEITNSETVTNAKGEFEIVFKAIPDESVSKDSNPVFTYEVTADVTDINGESRSATSIIKVGYHSLIASISLDDKIDKNTKETLLKIDTKNLNDEFVAAKGNIKIYKLNAPKNPLRKRPWNAPDYQDISENTFRTLFPNDPYTNKEADEKNWQKSALIFTENFDTETSKEIVLKNTKNWISGKYIVVLKSKDKFGQEVKDEKRFTIFSSKEKKIADNKLFTITTNKSFYKIGDKAEIQIGSASKNITVVVQVEKNHKIVDTFLVALNNNTKTIKIPVKHKDLGGFAVKYHFVNYNYFQSGNLLVTVPEKQENIQIETNIFRDKLQPGTEETWSFTIKDDKNSKVAAEVLASMYDASLDEFKTHNWSFNPMQENRNYYSYSTSNANQSFGTVNFRITNNQRNYYHFSTINYPTYNWFGFSLNKNNWLNRQYLKTTKRKLETTRKEFDGIITGIIEDKNGDPLPGVSIIIDGTNFGTETDFDGNYNIKIKKGDVLVFNYLGYKPKEFLITNQTNLDVLLEEDANALDEIVVVGYGTRKKESVVGAVAYAKTEALKGTLPGVIAIQGSGIPSKNDVEIFIRGQASWNDDSNPLILVDGVITNIKDVNFNDIQNISILKGDVAEGIYGAKAANGVVLITTNAGFKKIEENLLKVQARKNFKETAFFFPQLKTDKNGKVSFTFTMPEALTRWKLQLLAHTKNIKTATKTIQTVTQKELMVVPNAPRFLREGDKIRLSAKITNLTNNQLHGFSKLILTDPISGKELDLVLNNLNSNKSFKVDINGNTNVSWNLSIPETVQAVQYKIVAKSGNFSDGEQNVLPVLTNRMLVTESLPMFVKSKESKTFTLDKLKNTTSSSLKNHKLTLEITSNPVWVAIQSLPYLMEYPYECAEQTFAKYYANTLASFVADSNPKIQEVFNAWKNSDALLSNLEKNEELKSIIIQETPWLRDAQSESEQKKRIALLFDLNKMKKEQKKSIKKLQDIQLNSGGFPWFKGGRYASNFITQHIATGFGHLQKLSVSEIDDATKIILEKAVKYLDAELLENYENLIKNAKKTSSNQKNKKREQKAYEAYLAKNNLSYVTIQYLYMRSFYGDIKMSDKLKTAVSYYQNQSAMYWNNYNLYAKGQIALSLFRNNQQKTANKILKSLKENAITSNELGMYWKENKAGYYYYQSPVETQALLIETFSEIENDVTIINNLKIWLLKNKQTNRWKTTKATTEAVYSLLLNGSDWISITQMVDITIGNEKIDPSTLENVKVEAGTGYFKTSWNGNDISPKMSEVTINKKGNGIAWGSLYWQYFEDLDKITSAETPLKINKKLFLKVNTDTGKELQEITEKTLLKVGDLITVRIELRSDRNMEFIHLKDMRASGVEPINVLSTYKWQDNLGYYESTKDAATNFFFDRLPKGIYVFEYDVRVNNAGDFSNGITTIQSMYAPEFSSHSKGVRLKVEK